MNGNLKFCFNSNEIKYQIKNMASLERDCRGKEKALYFRTLHRMSPLLWNKGAPFSFCTGPCK